MTWEESNWAKGHLQWGAAQHGRRCCGTSVHTSLRSVLRHLACINMNVHRAGSKKKASDSRRHPQTSYGCGAGSRHACSRQAAAIGGSTPSRAAPRAAAAPAAACVLLSASPSAAQRVPAAGGGRRWQQLDGPSMSDTLLSANLPKQHMQCIYSAKKQVATPAGRPLLPATKVWSPESGKDGAVHALVFIIYLSD